MYTADRRLWLTADREQVVEDGDDKAAFLLAGPGDEIADTEAERLGLVKPKAPKAAPPATNKAAPKAADK